MIDKNKEAWKIIVFIIFGVLLILNFLPVSDVVIYPLRLLTLFTREAGRCLTAFFLQGKNISFFITPEVRSAFSMTIGKHYHLLMLISGYFIMLILSCIMVVSVIVKDFEKIVFFILSIFFFFSSFLFTTGDIFTLTFGFTFVFVFVLLMSLVNKSIQKMIVIVISMQWSLAFLEEMSDLLFNSKDASKGMVSVYLNNNFISIGSIVWALLLSIISIVLYLSVLYISIRKIQVKKTEAPAPSPPDNVPPPPSDATPL